MSKTYYSSFNPHEIDEKTLERLFVARKDLAADVMESIHESATTGNKHQRLLIGPRGIGKTHFVTLIYRRVRKDPDLDGELRIAWLNEDLRIHNYAGLLLAILNKLGKEYGDESVTQAIEQVLDLTDLDLQEAVLEQKILDFLGRHTLLLITENLDDLLTLLKEGGQRKLRALIQTRGNVTILATSTSLVDSVMERKKTFFGFFRISTLEPLEVEEATQLLALLAEEDGEPELAQIVRGPLGLARIRAVHYLAGGNPRVYVLLYDFLSRESLDNLTRPFMRLIDGLTPYYQSRMDRLSPLQRTVIDVLSRHREPLAVAKIARQAMSSPQSISSQLGQLRNLGYVARVASVGRETYYELREPLMRFCLQVKEQQGRTIELFVQFLRVWYSEPELDRLAASSAGIEQEAARRAMLEQDPLLPTLAADFASHQSAGNHELALAAAESAIERSPGLKVHWLRKARSLDALNRPARERLSVWEKVVELDPEDAGAWNVQSVLLYDLGHFDQAVTKSRKAFELVPDSPNLVRNYSFFLSKVGREIEARNSREAALELSGEPTGAADWDQRAIDLSELQRMDEAWAAFRRSLEEDPRRVSTWGHLWYRLQEDCRFRLFHDMAVRVVELLPDQAYLHSYLGTAQMHLGRFEQARGSYERALAIDPDLDSKGEPTGYYLTLALKVLGRNEAALEAIENYETESERMRFQLAFSRVSIQLELGRYEQGEAELNELLGKYRPPLWAGRDLTVATPLVVSSDPAVWRPTIEVWLACCERHGCLDELGQGLVRSLRSLAIPRISDQAARAWHETWRTLAAGVEQLELPLKLYRAGVEFRAGAGQRALLGLAKEERGLLEPWLGNLFAEEPDELDREMRILLHWVEARIAELSEEERRRAFWSSAPPDLAPAVLTRLLATYGARGGTRLQPLLPGSWEELQPGEVEPLLRLTAEQDDLAARAWSRPGLEVLGAGRRALAFSAWHLFQIHFQEEGRAGAIDLLAGEDQAVMLDGRSQALFDLVNTGAIELDNDKARLEYTRFFCSMVRAAGGRFRIIEALADVPFVAPSNLPEDLGAQPWAAAPTGVGEDGASYTGTVLYADTLFKATFRLNSFTLGYVEMLEDGPIAEDLEIWREQFDGPLRLLPRGQENGD